MTPVDLSCERLDRPETLSFFPREGVACSPLLFLLAGVCVSLLGVARGTPLLIASSLAPLTVWGLLLLFSEHRPLRFFQYVAVISLLAFLGAMACGYRMSRPPLPPSGRIREEGTVTFDRSWGARRAVLVDAPSGRFMMKIAPDRHLFEGDVVTFSGYAAEISSRPGSSFREDLYWRARGASWELFPDSIIKRKGGVSLARWRTWLRRSVLLDLPSRTRGYLLAALLGVRDPELTEAHRRWGTSHLLAVSGFHVGLVALGFWKLLSIRRMRLLIPRRGAVFVSSLLLWLYVLLAGGAPGALRAALMIQTLLLGSAFGRKGTPVNSVSLAALLLLLWRPEWFFDVGWRLSVMAALLLSALAVRCPSFWMLPLSSLLIWIACFPQVTATFGEVPVVGLLLNIAALPLFSILYPLAFLFAFPIFMGFSGGGIVAGVPEGLFILWERIAEITAGILPWTLPWSPLLAVLGGGTFILTVFGGLFPLRGRTFAGAGIFFMTTVLLL